MHQLVGRGAHGDGRLSIAKAAAATVLLFAFRPFLALALSSSASRSGPPVVLADRAPGWSDLRERVLRTATGDRLNRESTLRDAGLGPPHVDATLRLFDGDDGGCDANDEKNAIANDASAVVRVTLYRDSSSWCPYCQKVWTYLEEKRIPYRTVTVPLDAYGDKPAWYTRLVDGGKLPALELDGVLHVESMNIMETLEEAFPARGPSMVPKSDTEAVVKAERLLNLEEKLQSAWFSLVFHPVHGEALVNARETFLAVLGEVDAALGDTPGPWFLGGKDPSIVDLQYVSHVERIVASVLYWKGLQIRNTKFQNIDRWLEAWESRPSYIATKSDCYTLVMSMPSQNGPGYFIDEAREVADRICGLRGEWDMDRGGKCDDPPLLEPLAPLQSVGGEEAARHEAAYKLVVNRDAIVTFATRGAGEEGRPSYHAELADPHAEPNEDCVGPVDACLRHVAAALLDGIDSPSAVRATDDLAGRGGTGELRENWDEFVDDSGATYWWNDVTGEARYGAPPTRQLDSCLAYLRDRVGVPRDVGQAAAMQLRKHLNWAIGLLQ